ncbi:GL26554 [Drosophila persimilis]|uniref:GL26554 n=1 Tax=Drosophila persimilis TaxID=7234 RepID=B4GSK3_DROPE|nr:GL26554 [Drosophila persimilis]
MSLQLTGRHIVYFAIQYSYGPQHSSQTHIPCPFREDYLRRNHPLMRYLRQAEWKGEKRALAVVKPKG